MPDLVYNLNWTHPRTMRTLNSRPLIGAVFTALVAGWLALQPQEGSVIVTHTPQQTAGLRPIPLDAQAAPASLEQTCADLERRVAELEAWRKKVEARFLLSGDIQSKPSASEVGAAIGLVPELQAGGLELLARDAGKPGFKAEFVNKVLLEGDQSTGYRDQFGIDLRLRGGNLAAPTRMLKGRLWFGDLLQEGKFSVPVTLMHRVTNDQWSPIVRATFAYDIFDRGHQWLRTLQLGDFEVKLWIDEILYEDGKIWRKK